MNKQIDLELWKKSYFSLRRGKFLFLESQNNKLFAGPYTDEELSEFEKNVKLLSINNTKYISPYDNINPPWIVFPDPSVNYPIILESSYVTRDGTYVAHINEFRSLIDICDSERWVYQKDLLITLGNLYLLGINIKLEDIFVDLVNKTFYIFDLIPEQNEVVFQYNKEPCVFLDIMGKYYNEIADVFLKTHSDDLKLPELVKVLRDLSPYPETPKEKIIKSKVPKMITPPDPIDWGSTKITTSGGITYSGFDFYELLRLLNYYIRRNIENKALAITAELYKFSEFKKTSANNLYMNFLDTLKLITIKDIGNFTLALGIIDMLNNLPDFNQVMSIVFSLCRSEKSRIIEEIWETFSNNKCRFELQKHKVLIKDVSIKDESKFIRFNISNPSIKNESPDIKNHILRLWNRLLKRDPTALIAFVYFYEDVKKFPNSQKRISYTDSDIHYTEDLSALLWEIIDSVTQEKEKVNIFRKAYYTSIKEENKVYYFLAMIIAIIENFSFESVYPKIYTFDSINKYMIFNQGIEFTEQFTALFKIRSPDLKEIKIEESEITPVNPYFDKSPYTHFHKVYLNC